MDFENMEQGYTYLELKDWKNAEHFFKKALLTGSDKGKSYLGSLLTELKCSDFDELKNKDIIIYKSQYYDLCLKYCDDEIKEALVSHAEVKKSARKKQSKKIKKVTLSTALIVACVGLLSAATYYVFIPAGRYSNYEKSIADGKIREAANSYSSSKWFEYDDKVLDLFYSTGTALVENSDYESAIPCFEIKSDYKDSGLYYNYCNGKIFHNNNELSAYDYFKECTGFLDTDEIISSSESYKSVKKLFGSWSRPPISKTEWEKQMRESGNYYEINGHFIDKSYYITYSDALRAVEEAGALGTVQGLALGQVASCMTIEINDTSRLSIKDNEVYISYNSEDCKIDFIDDNRISFSNYTWIKDVP